MKERTDLPDASSSEGRMQELRERLDALNDNSLGKRLFKSERESSAKYFKSDCKDDDSFYMHHCIDVLLELLAVQFDVLETDINDQVYNYIMNLLEPFKKPKRSWGGLGKFDMTTYSRELVSIAANIRALFVPSVRAVGEEPEGISANLARTIRAQLRVATDEGSE